MATCWTRQLKDGSPSSASFWTTGNLFSFLPSGTFQKSSQNEEKRFSILYFLRIVIPTQEEQQGRMKGGEGERPLNKKLSKMQTALDGDFQQIDKFSLFILSTPL